MGKTVEESKNEIASVTNSVETKNNSTNTINSNSSTSKKEATNTVKEASNTVKETTTNSKTSKQEEQKVEKKEISFVKPVDGEISKEYAKDSLLYSETLQEWTTHLGIDIKADKTTVVKAAEAGKIKSIKNDPRYGLTIVIEHQDGYETLYANLLTSEFVQVGEEVKQGQSIGTVGNSATFEIADATHLHFEISKNGENQDPTNLIK